MRWLRIAVTALTIGVLFWTYPLGEVAGYVGAAGMAGFGAAVAMVLVGIALMALKWSLLLPRVPIRTLVLALFAYCFYALLPAGQLGGEIAKALVVRERHPAAAGVVSSILLDKVTGLLGLLLVAVAALTLSSAVVPWWEYALIAGMTFACLASMVFAGLLARAMLRWSPTRPGMASRGWTSMILVLQEIAAFAAHRTGFVETLALGFVSQAAMVACYLLLASPLGIDLPLASLAGAVALANLAGLVPISIAGFGVREAGLVALLTTRHHVPGAQAFALSLAVMATFLVPALIGGALEVRRLVATRVASH